MSVGPISAVFKHSASKGSARLVLLAMADEAHDSGLLAAYPRSYNHLSRKANVDVGTVARAVKTLVELGELEVIQRGDGRASTDYRLILPGLGDEGRQDAHPGPSGSTPRVGEVHTQGTQDAHPIIPFSPVDNPVSPKDSSDTSPVTAVFEAWTDSTNRTARTVLDSKRRKVIAAALKTHPLPDVLDAVRGWQNSPWHRGENPERRPYNDLGLLLRDAENIEKFRDLARGPRIEKANGRPHPAHDPRIDTDRSGPNTFGPLVRKRA